MQLKHPNTPTLKHSFLNFPKFSNLGIAPQTFEFVEMTCFRVKNVYYYIEIIHQNPGGIAGAFGMGRRRLQFILHFFENAVRNGVDMRVGIAFTNDEKIGRCFPQFAEIQLDDIFAFFIADALDDGVVKVFYLRFFCPPCWCGRQNA
mgnify:CR=1 FL=1